MVLASLKLKMSLIVSSSHCNLPGTMRKETGMSFSLVGIAVVRKGFASSGNQGSELTEVFSPLPILLRNPSEMISLEQLQRELLSGVSSP